MKITFQNKLIIFIVLVVAISALPLIIISVYVSANSLKETYSVSAKHTINIVENNFNNVLNQLILTKTLTVKEEKDKLYEKAHQTSDLLYYLKSRKHSFSDQIEELNKNASNFFVYPMDNITKKPKLEFLSYFNMSGHNTTDIIESCYYSYNSDFYLVAQSDKIGKNLDKDLSNQFMLYVLPVDDLELVIVAYLEFDIFEFQYKNSVDTFDELVGNYFNEFSSDGLAAAYNLTTERVAVREDVKIADATLAKLKALVANKVYESNIISGDGDYIFYYKYMPSYNTVVFMGYPLDLIDSALIELGLNQLVFSLILLAVLLLISLRLSYSFFSPLNKLIKIVSHFSHYDFSKKPNFFKDKKIMQRSDEFGEMARTFEKMGEDLYTNITNLLKTNATKERLESELELAAQIQTGLLPKKLDNQAEFSLAAFLQPAKQIGGDLYDFFMIDEEHLAIAVGDVSGKGIAASLFMSIVMANIRTSLPTLVKPNKAMFEINNALCCNNPYNMFVTLFLGVYNIRTGELEYCSGGHPYPIVFNNRGARVIECEPDLVLGSISDIDYELQHLKLDKNDSLLIYTDGLSEARNINGDFYGEDGIINVLSILENKKPEVALQHVYVDAKQFFDSILQADDITLLILRREL